MLVAYILWTHNDHPVIRVLIHLLWCCCWHFNPVVPKWSFIPRFRDSWVQAAIEAAGWVFPAIHEWHMLRFPILTKKTEGLPNQHKNGFRTGFLISNFTIQFAILARLLIRFFSRKKSYWKKYFSSLSKVGSWSSGVIHASSQAVQDLVDQSLQRWLGWMIGILTWMVQFFYYSPTFSRQGIYIGKMSLHNMPQIHRWNLPNKKMQMVVIPLLRFGAFLWWWWFVVWPPHLYIYIYSPIIPIPPQSHQTRTKSQGSIEGFGGHGIIPLRGRRMARGKVSLFVELVGEGSHWRIIVVSNSN